MGRIEHITTAAVKATPSVPVKLTRSNITS